MKIDQILIKPVVTEKALNKAKEGVYVFEVAKGANKHQIKEAAERLFDVSVSQVKTATRKGKERRVGRRLRKKRLPDKKIAYLQVKKGKIDLFPKT